MYWVLPSCYDTVINGKVGLPNRPLVARRSYCGEFPGRQCSGEPQLLNLSTVASQRHTELFPEERERAKEGGRE